MRRGAGVVLGVLGVALASAPVSAGAPRCEGRYFLTEPVALPEGFAALDGGILVDGSKVSLGSVCDATRARVRAREEGDRLRVAFSAWRWVRGSASFAGSIDDFYNG